MKRIDGLTIFAFDPYSRRTWLVLAALWLACAFEAAAQSSMHGLIVDDASGAAIAGVNVRVQNRNVGTITDAQGRFHLPLTDETQTLVATRVGYEALTQAVMAGEGRHRAQPVTLLMSAAVLRLREVTVTPGAFRFMDGAAARQTLSRGDIEAAPQFSDDIFRAIHRMPGLSAGDFAARFSVRGGRHDETLILLDGLEIYEPYHMKDFNEGAISIVDVETIDGVELMTGGFPVQYGNRRSGVFHIHSRTPPTDGTRHSVGLSVMNLRAMSEGGFGEGRGSWFVSARRGYLDLMLDLMGINDIAAPVYYDVFSKLTWELTPDHEVAVRLLHAGDSFDMDEFATTGFQDTVDTHETALNSYGNSYFWATLTSTLNDHIAVESMAHVGLVSRDRVGAELFTKLPDGVYDLDKRSDLRLLGFKQDWFVETNPALLWQAGFELRSQQADYRFNNVVFKDPNDPSPDPLGLYPVTTSVRGTRDGTLIGVYGLSRVRLIDPITIEAGLRFDQASHTDDSDLSPRLSALFDLPTGSRLRLGWGLYRQMHDIHDEAALNVGGLYDPSELTRTWTAGIEHPFGDGTMARVEIYDKHSDNPRPVYRNWVAGALDVFPETNEDLLLVDIDRTTARGLEVYLTHDRGKRFAWRASYALSRSQEEIASIVNINVPDDPLSFGDENPAPRDQRHAGNVDLIWRPNPKWTVNLAFAYHSGWPITIAVPEETVRPDGTPDIVARPEALYSSRLPAYHRLDVRMTRRMQTRRGDLRVFLELINLANRENVFAYDYERDVRKDGTAYLAQDTESWFPLLPSIGLSWSW